jgi:AbrB family looped-hinge helix DNA binding protein
MPQHKAQMDQLTNDLRSVSDKIRALDRAGFARAEIAKYLGKRYQHVRNVLVSDKAKGRKADGQQRDVSPVKTRLGGEGRIIIPSSYREAMGVGEGDALYLRLEGNELHVSPLPAVTERVRTILRKFIPEGTSLVDELIRERRRESKHETGND